MSASIEGSAFIVHPLERHDFVDDPSNDFLSRVCRRPRALHRAKEYAVIPSNVPPDTCRIRSQSFGAIVGSLLTDKKIDAYARKGYYSLEFQLARGQLWQSRRERNSHFEKHDGRLIYRP